MRCGSGRKHSSDDVFSSRQLRRLRWRRKKNEEALLGTRKVGRKSKSEDKKESGGADTVARDCKLCGIKLNSASQERIHMRGAKHAAAVAAAAVPTAVTSSVECDAQTSLQPSPGTSNHPPQQENGQVVDGIVCKAGLLVAALCAAVWLVARQKGWRTAAHLN